MKIKLFVSIVGAAVILVSCAVTPTMRDLNTPAQNFAPGGACDGIVKSLDSHISISSSLAYKMGENLSAANQFLDCYIYDLETRTKDHYSIPAKVDDNALKSYDSMSAEEKNVELLLYRGHIVVTMLARYAALTVTGQNPIHDINFSSYEGLKGDVADILKAIETAELELRYASRLDGLQKFKKIGKDSEDKLLLVELPRLDATPYVSALDRTAAVFQIASAAIEPGIQRAKWFTDVIWDGLVGFATGAFSSLGSIVDPREAANRAIDGLKKAFIVNQYGRAYLKSARFDMNRVRGTLSGSESAVVTGVDPAGNLTKVDWEEWDERLLDACQTLAIFTDSTHNCLPYVEDTAP